MTEKDILLRVQSRLLEMAAAVSRVLERENIPYWITAGNLLGAIRHKGWIPWDGDFDMVLMDDTYDQAIEILQRELPDDMFVEYFNSEPLYFHYWAHVKDVNSECLNSVSPQDGSYKHKGISVDLYRVKRIKAKDMFEHKRLLYIEYLNRRHNHGLIEEDDYMNRIQKLQDLDVAKNMIRIDYRKPLNLDEDVYVGGTRSVYYPDELFPLKKYRFMDEDFLGPNNADPYLTRIYGDYMQLPPVEKRKPSIVDVKFF